VNTDRRAFRGVLGRLALGAALAAALIGAAPAAAAPWDLPPGSFPRAYDLRAHGKVTPVRSQDEHSTCWIMAAMGSLESNLLPTASYDLSENNLANHMGSKLTFEGRANSRLSTAYFARWDGPVFERDDPYPRPGLSPEFLLPVRHIQEVLFLPARKGPLDNKAIKWAVMKYGAIDAAMAYQRDSINFATGGAFYTRDTFLDHHVCIAGWNDDYPATRFLRRPPGNGAFLIKNSWGADWNNGGYFWVSYYDAGIGRELAVFDGAQARTNFDAIYQYDALGWTTSMGYGGSDHAWFANRFTCGGTGKVAAVSFYTPVPGCAYQVRVAGTVRDVAAAPVAGTGTIAVGGYHTVQLATPVAVTAGQEFVVAVRLTTPGYGRPIPVEHPSSLIAPRAAARQSYISFSGATWTDVTIKPGFETSNVCLKAFVDSGGAGDTAAPKAVVGAAQARSGGLARVPFSFTDPAFSSASAVIYLSVRTAGGRVLKHARMPAVAFAEPGVWRFGCTMGAGTYYVYARAYDAAGNRQSVPTRAVLKVL
jgi:C1A family cysteine protease